MFWTTLLLIRHSSRLWQARTLVLAFVLLLLIWSLPGISRPAAGELLSQGGVSSLVWPRWLAYAWLMLEARRADELFGLRFELHPLAGGPRASLFSWYSYRCLLEVLLLWACAELLMRLVELGAGLGFHVEPVAVLSNFLLVTSIFLLSHSLRILLSGLRIAVPLLLGLFLLAELLSQTAFNAEQSLELSFGFALFALAGAFLSLTREDTLC